MYSARLPEDQSIIRRNPISPKLKNKGSEAAKNKQMDYSSRSTTVLPPIVPQKISNEALKQYLSTRRRNSMLLEKPSRRNYAAVNVKSLTDLPDLNKVSQG